MTQKPLGCKADTLLIKSIVVYCYVKKNTQQTKHVKRMQYLKNSRLHKKQLNQIKLTKKIKLKIKMRYFKQEHDFDDIFLFFTVYYFLLLKKTRNEKS